LIGCVTKANEGRVGTRQRGFFRGTEACATHVWPDSGFPRCTGFQPVSVLRTGSRPPLLVAQVVNLCVFPVRIGLAASSPACDSGRGSSRIGNAQKPVRRVPRGGRSGAFEPRTHSSRRRRACRRPAAVALHRARITCRPYHSMSAALFDRPALHFSPTLTGSESNAQSWSVEKRQAPLEPFA
jgi:hypothetical protein